MEGILILYHKFNDSALLLLLFFIVLIVVFTSRKCADKKNGVKYVWIIGL